jgi:NAD(P)-dependent dehydrogenase (short-subunit alcohol dehydrogenase family)
MGRYGRVPGVSDLIAFLASGNSSGFTGQNIRIDGRISRPV